MKLFHISDVLTITTGRLVSSRHIDGAYALLNFLTGDEIFTHQIPRAMRECKPWMRSMFPNLMDDSNGMPARLADLDERIKSVKQDSEHVGTVVAAWVEELRLSLGLPEMLPVYELGADIHTRIDPIEEAEAMLGKGRVIGVQL